MSATTATDVREFTSRTPTPTHAPMSLWLFAVFAIALDLVLVVFGLWDARQSLAGVGWGLAAWVLVVALVGVASVPADSGPQLGLDMPLLLAAAFLFGPGIAGAIAFIGYVDVREFKGDISLVRALYNRAQTSLSVMAAAVVFSVVDGQINEWPAAILVSLVAVAADCLVNYGLVVAAKALHDQVSPWDILGGLRVGAARTFLVTYLSYGLLSPILGQIYLEIGSWGLVAFALPALLARQAFEQSRRLEAANGRLRTQSAALRDMSSRVADERRDERLAVAAGLHDEVLPPLYNVHLMGQVLRRDLAAGRLLDLEGDVPSLLQAVDTANDAVRGLIGGLRESPLGTGGLGQTLGLLVRHLETLTAAKIEVHVGEVDGPPLTQLLAFYVLREALTNAVKHANASVIRVHADTADDSVRITVEDDGKGFDPAGVDTTSHFGLSLMRERVDLVGGLLHVQTLLNGGTRVVARLPLELTD